MHYSRFGGANRVNATRLLAAIFILFTAALVTLIVLYWAYTLEPALRNNERSNSTALAQVYGKLIANTLARNINDISSISVDIEEMLLLVNQEGGLPFILGVDIELIAPLASNYGLSDNHLKYGNNSCDDCFVVDIPFFDQESRELIGVARFYANSSAHQSMVNDVRLRLLALTVIALIMLFIAWNSVNYLVQRVSSGERMIFKVFETAPFPMILADYDRQRIIHPNKAAGESLGLTEGMSLSDIESSIRDVINNAVVLGEVRSQEISVSKNVGDSFGWAIISATRLDHEQEKYIVAGLADITNLRDVQEALDLAKSKAEAASKAKSEFLATMSHEIRTPMNGILGMVQLLQRSNLDDNQIEYAQAILRSGNSLLLLLNDILEFSRMESCRLELKCTNFSLDMLLDEISSLMSPVAKEKEIVLSHMVTSDVPRLINADAARLRQILLNIVGNAVKFTDKGKIETTVSYSSPAVDGYFLLHFSVIDTGIGIPPEMHSMIFDRFSQGEQGMSRRYGGSGLGLAISQGLVRLMGGEITVSSSPGVGSNFSFSVRVRAATNEGEIEEALEVYRKPKRKLHILVVEDVAINRRVVKGLLDTEGHEVVEAINGEEAVLLAESRHFDAILMDLQMPVLDGYAATSLIRSGNGRSHDTPIIALTANILHDEQQRCTKVGMCGFIVKPFTLDKLNNELFRVTDTASSELD